MSSQSMQAQSEEKVPGGKLLRVKVELNNSKSKILKIQITGDFFIHPEEKLKIIEAVLSNKKTDISEKQLNDIISNTIMKNDINLIGIDSEAIARNVRRAIDNF